MLSQLQPERGEEKERRGMWEAVCSKMHVRRDAACVSYIAEVYFGICVSEWVQTADINQH